MSASQVSKEILNQEPRIKFVNITKDSKQDTSINQDNRIDENEIKMSINQTPHLIESGKRFTELGTLESIVFNYDQLKVVNLPLSSELVICGVSNDVNIDEIKTLVSKNVIGYEFKKELKHQGDEKIGIKNKSFNENRFDDHNIKDSSVNPIQIYALSMIDFWKEFSISSIKMNEKFVKEFWKTFKEI